MKLRDTRLIVPPKAFPINPEIVRARAVTAELQLNIKKAHEPLTLLQLCGASIMLLRDHPLMTYRRLPNWPPVWSWTDGLENHHPKGEVGTLKAVFRSAMQPTNRCFLLIRHEGSEYLGCLLFDDEVFCSQVMEILKAHCNRSIAEIGGIDLAYTL